MCKSLLSIANGDKKSLKQQLEHHTHWADQVDDGTGWGVSSQRMYPWE